MRLFRASLAVAGAAAVALGAPAGARERPVPVPADAHRVAVRIASWGPRPAGSDGEALAQRLLARVFRGAGLRVGTQEFRVPHHGRSGNVIGVFDTPRSSARGLGLGRRLLTELEGLAASRGARVARLDTHRALVEAMSLYRSAGYREIPAFNDDPFSDHWFEKELYTATGSTGSA